MRPGIYRNVGAPWNRPDGTTIRRGEEFRPTPEELLRRSYKLVLVGTPPDDPLPIDVNVEDYATGNGWYLIDGVKIQGRANAEETLAGALKKDVNPPERPEREEGEADG